MEKIVFVINTEKVVSKAIDFACNIAALTHSNLTGYFVEGEKYESSKSNRFTGHSYFSATHDTSSSAAVAVKMDIDLAIRYFLKECELKGVRCDVMEAKSWPVEEIIYESRFCDMLILNPDLVLTESDTGVPSHFVKEILAHAECPVIVSPEESDGLDEVVFCYDGSASSVFAIKQFIYLLPELYNKKTVLLEINTEGNYRFNESHRRIMDFLKAHYSDVSFSSLTGAVPDELFVHFFMEKKKLIVMGAYGRTFLSNFFKRSSADILVRAVDLPLFITHH